jgi:diguanylate cyclase (GGDEF)-like protein
MKAVAALGKHERLIAPIVMRGSPKAELGIAVLGADADMEDVSVHDRPSSPTPEAQLEPSSGVPADGLRNPLVASGLTLAACVLLWKPLLILAGQLNALGDALDLQLLPAIAVVATIFGVHQYRRRRHLLLVAERAVRDDQASREQIHDMTRLVAFSQALLTARDEAAIRAVTETHMPVLVNKRPAARDAGSMPAAAAPDSARSGRDRFLIDNAKELMAAALQASESFREVYENSRQDALTGCFNRTHALETLEGELRRARRSRTPFSLLMFDLDQFKDINDRFGHLCGDAVLSAVGARMKAATRSSDIKCRYGGDEFLVILPDTPIGGARQVCETLRRAIAKDPIPWSSGEVHVTASFGVTEITPGEIEPMAIVARADAGLYDAKRQGRNCVSVAPAAPPMPSESSAAQHAGPLKAVS